MKMVENGWEFNDQVTKDFDYHVKQSVLGYEDCSELITRISKSFLTAGERFYDVGISTGNIAKRIINNGIEDLRCTGIDNSESMINNFDNEGLEIQLINHNLSYGYNFESNNLTVSMLTLQFMGIEEREDLVKDIYFGLNKGGAFLLVEKVESEIGKFEKLFNDIHEEFKVDSDISFEEVYKKRQSLRAVMKCLSISENMKMLRDAGFNKVDIFYKNGNFVGIIAIK